MRDAARRCSSGFSHGIGCSLTGLERERKINDPTQSSGVRIGCWPLDRLCGCSSAAGERRDDGSWSSSSSSSSSPSWSSAHLSFGVCLGGHRGPRCGPASALTHPFGLFPRPGRPLVRFPWNLRFLFLFLFVRTEF